MIGDMKKNNKEETQKISELKEEVAQLREDIKECESEKAISQDEVKEWKEKAQNYYDQLLRLKAEFENYRKRIEKEKTELIEWARYDFILSLLPLFEMMKIARSHLSMSNVDVDNIKTGLSMIFSEFEKIFKNVGLTELDVLNKPYDPMKCEIIGTVDGSDEDDGKVVEVIQPGYALKDRILKPAKVKIAKRISKEESNDKSSNGNN